MTTSAARSESEPSSGPASTREALLDAVDELLEERGWAGCSLQAVARRAGLTTGAVYSTFGSRGALIAAYMARRTADVTLLDPDEPDLARAVATYARTFHAMGAGAEGTNLVTAQLDLLRLTTTDPNLADAMRDTYLHQLAGLVSDIEVRAGDTVLAGPPAEVAQRMVAVLQGLTLQRFALATVVEQSVFVDAALAAVGLLREGRR